MADISVNTRFLGLKDVHLHIEDRGTGRPIILIHGWPLSGASWKEQVDVFVTAGYRVITYDRRGFGESDKPKTGYDYDTLSDDLNGLIEALELNDITLVGFSMGGGEVARYIAKYGEEKLHSVVFASAIPPMLMNTPDNPDGPLTAGQAAAMTAQLTANSEQFYETFVKQFFSAHADEDVLVTPEQEQDALALTKQADKVAALEAMASFATTDFREDLTKVTAPALVIHGDADGIVLFEGSAKRTHEAVAHSELHVVSGGPHGINVSHAQEFNAALIEFFKQ